MILTALLCREGWSTYGGDGAHAGPVRGRLHYNMRGCVCDASGEGVSDDIDIT